VAKPRDVPGLDCEEPFARAAARVVEVRTAEVFEHSAGVLGLQDVEPLHDMRVATRRLRAALEMFRPCFPRKRYRAALGQVKELADALGERRDADVTIAALEQFTESLAAPDRRGVASLLAQVRAEQAEANDRLEAFVQPLRLAALSERLSELAVEAEGLAAEEPA
jgi:CHAD domain-containing protein